MLMKLTKKVKKRSEDMKRDKGKSIEGDFRGGFYM